MKRRITKLISGNDSTIILLSYDTYWITDDCSASIFVKHVKPGFDSKFLKIEKKRYNKTDFSA